MYVSLASELKSKIKIRAMAHITGGGMENLPRVLPADSSYRLVDWEWPAAFHEVQKRSGLSKDKMMETFNCGVGLVVVTSPEDSQQVHLACQNRSWKSFHLGEMR